MRKIILLTFIIINIFASNISSFDILENGKIKQIKIKQSHVSNSARSINSLITTSRGLSFDNSSRILVKFQTIPSSVKSFEHKYNLKFVKIMAIGYFVFENSNHSSITKKLSDIIKTEQIDKEYILESIEPSWRFNNTKF